MLEQKLVGRLSDVREVAHAALVEVALVDGRHQVDGVLSKGGPMENNLCLNDNLCLPQHNFWFCFGT